MSDTINIYCDESCHLQNDGHRVMTLGALWCPLEKRQEISVRLREIKGQHKISPTTEIKWVKVSPAKAAFYQDWIDYFFDDDDLHFRGVVIPDKTELTHEAFDQTHDDWYYKMLFTMLKVVLSDKIRHRIYIDLKDTHSASKAAKLHEVLCNSAYDFDKSIIERVQPVRSHEVELLQLCDLLIGALGYANRGLSTSVAKTQLVQRIRERSHLSLTRNTLLRASKINLLIWEGGRSNG
jgi:hypothetical protein